jgi:hypothetical protein
MLNAMNACPIMKAIYVSILLLLTVPIYSQKAPNSSFETLREYSISKTTSKDYESGKRIVYFRLSGVFTEIELEKLQRALRGHEGILRASIFDLTVEKRDHVLFVECLGDHVTEKWMTFTMNQLIKELK